MTQRSYANPIGTRGVDADVRRFYEELWILLPPPPDKVIWMSTRCFVGVPGTGGCAEDDWAMWIHRKTGEWCCSGCHAHGGPREAAIERGLTPDEAEEMLVRYRMLQGGVGR